MRNNKMMVDKLAEALELMKKAQELVKEAEDLGEYFPERGTYQEFQAQIQRVISSDGGECGIEAYIRDKREANYGMIRTKRSR